MKVKTLGTMLPMEPVQPPDPGLTNIFAPMSTSEARPDFRAIWFAAILFWLVAVLSACDPGRVYEQNIRLPAQGWSKDSVYGFKFRIDDVSQKYNFLYHLRYDLNYPYYNFYIKMSIVDSLNNPLMEDRHEMVLMDPETGKPRGTGLGGVFNQDFTGLTNVRFTKPGLYKFRAVQYMRTSPVPGLQGFGLRVETGN